MDLGELAGIESSLLKLSNPFISHSITPQVFPRGSFLSQLSFAIIWRWVDKNCTQNHFQISVEVKFFSDINFSISMIYRFNSLALLRMRNAPTDKLLRHNVMLCVQCYHAVADKWVLRRSGWSNIIFSLPGMYAKWQSHQIWMIPCSSRIDSNIIILIRFDRSCVSIGPCFD